MRLVVQWDVFTWKASTWAEILNDRGRCSSIREGGVRGNEGYREGGVLWASSKPMLIPYEDPGSGLHSALCTQDSLHPHRQHGRDN